MSSSASDKPAVVCQIVWFSAIPEKIKFNRDGSCRELFLQYAKWLGLGSAEPLTFAALNYGAVPAQTILSDVVGDASSCILEVVAPEERQLVQLSTCLQQTFPTRTLLATAFDQHSVLHNDDGRCVMTEAGFLRPPGGVFLVRTLKEHKSVSCNFFSLTLSS